VNFSARKLIGEETKFKCIHCGDQTNIVEVMLDPSLLVALFGPDRLG